MAKRPPVFLNLNSRKSSDVFPNGVCASAIQLLWDLLALLQGMAFFAAFYLITISLPLRASGNQAQLATCGWRSWCSAVAQGEL